MPSNSAEYQRAYRARKKGEADPKVAGDALDVAQTRIAELEQEVAHLKRLLAQRPSSSHPFGVPRPAPKPSH